MKISIDELGAREVLDSRGNPTVEVDIKVQDRWFRASVPSGASTGSHEALELRDGDTSRYGGKGVLGCIKNLRDKILPKIRGQAFDTAQELDEVLIELDGTPNKGKLGANSILPVSMAFHRAAASTQNLTLFEYLHRTYFPSRGLKAPVPMMNVVNGGKHADNPIAIQEFMVCPHLSQDATIQDRVRAGAEVYHCLKSLLKQAGYTTNVGDEGGFAPAMKDEHEVLSTLMEAIAQAGYQVGQDISLALDVAANECFDGKNYVVQTSSPPMSSADLCVFYDKLIQTFPAICSVEDPFFEDDWQGWKEFTETMQKRSDMMVVGDDLLVTNPDRLKKAISEKSCNAILIKINQIGSISEAAQTMNIAYESGFQTVVSHRSGETEDPFIAHLVTASGAGWLKSGAPCRTDRAVKYNELLRIFSQ